MCMRACASVCACVCVCNRKFIMRELKQILREGRRGERVLTFNLKAGWELPKGRKARDGKWVWGRKQNRTNQDTCG